MEQQTMTDLIHQIEDALGGRDVGAMLSAVHRATPAEQADLLLSLSPIQLSGLLRLLGQERTTELLEELPPADAARLLLRLSQIEAGAILDRMDPDDAVDVVQEFAPSQAEQILLHVRRETARDILGLLQYAPDSAGGIMTPEFVAVRPEATLADALSALRDLAADGEPEAIHYVYVADVARRLVGVLPLRALVLSRPSVPVAEVMLTDVVKVFVDEDQETAAHLISEHNLLALPVVDEEERLVGIITADDAIDVLQEETSEDIVRLGGSEPLAEPYLRATARHIIRRRLGWVMLLFVLGNVTSLVLRHFEASIEAVVSLTLFIPLLIGMGGVVGTQTVTTLVRAIALGEVRPRHILEILRKELMVAAALGVSLGFGNTLLAWLFGVPEDVRYTVGLTALLLPFWAAAVAVVLPLATHRLGIDPALISNPLLTNIVDWSGLLLYFTIAQWLVFR